MHVPERFHHLDAARALFMLLGIPFHAGMIYAAGHHWIVNASDRSEAIAGFVLVSQTFRMPGFFLIAGFFAAMLLDRQRPAAWLQTRVVRLGLPLLTALFVILPVQRAIVPETLMAGGYHDHFDYLWFLPDLLAMSAITAFAWPLIESGARSRPVEWIAGRSWVWPLFGIVAGLWEVAVAAYPYFTPLELHFADNWIDLDRPLLSVPFFAIGLLCWKVAGLREALGRFHWPTLVTGCAALASYAVFDGIDAHYATALSVFSANLAAMCLVASILAGLKRFAGRPSPQVRKLVDASFTVYLVHHPMIVGLGALFAAIALPSVLEWALICAVTLGLSLGVHALVARSPVALLAFNGIRPRRRTLPGLVVAEPSATSR